MRRGLREGGQMRRGLVAAVMLGASTQAGGTGPLIEMGKGYWGQPAFVSSLHPVGEKKCSVWMSNGNQWIVKLPCGSILETVNAARAAEKKRERCGAEGRASGDDQAS